METTLICSGLGGQGVMMIGQLLGYATCADENKSVTFYPSYGFEMRGGSANCYVVLSDERIGAAKFSKTDNVIALSEDALTQYLDSLKPGGNLFVNSSLIKGKIEREDIQIHYIDALEIAQEAGSPRSTNLVMLGAFVETTKVMEPDAIIAAMKYKFKKASDKVMASNILAFSKGREAVK